MLKKEIKHFIKETEKLIVCPKTAKKEILNDLTNDVNEYAEANNINDLDSIYEHFGRPEDIANGFMAEFDSKSIKKSINIKKFVIAAVILAFILLSVYLIAAFIDGHSASNGYFDDETISALDTQDFEN